jgi:D-glycero-alpha-D-manno-heptose 1-phosphate guanylyltransferase
MEAIVLAGGFGTRLREMVPDVPKPMAQVAGRPFLEILLNDLASKGFKRIVLSLGYKAEVIVTHFGKRFSGMDISYVVENVPLGTGGAARLGMSKCLGNHVFIFNGDTFLNLEADAVEFLWQKNRHPIIVTRKVSDTTRYGRLLVESGRVIGFTEKGVSGPGLINAGCYVLGISQLDDWPLNTHFSLEEDYLAHTVMADPVNFFETQGVFIDIGVPEDYLRAQTLLKNHA